MDRRIFLTTLAGAAAASFLPSTAEASNWKKLGTRKVDGLIDRDRITVGNSWGKFEKIRLRVRGNDLMMYDLDIR